MLGATVESHDIVVLGASAGGVTALKRLAASLPDGLPAALFVVVHTSPQSRSMLADILSGAGPLPALPAEDGMAVEHGRIVVAPPDHHLLLDAGRVAVVRGPRENRHRPAIDPLFRSAAWAYGPRVVAVVLTGGLDDGVAGLWAVKSCGGTTIVQEPADAEHPQLPLEVLLHNRVDHRLPLDQIGAQIARLAREPVAARTTTIEHPAGLVQETRAAHGDTHGIEAMSRLGPVSAFTCPACQGALWELNDTGDMRYRCHTGHAFGSLALLAGKSAEVERSLYSALRAVSEKSTALRRLAERWSGGMPTVRKDYERRAEELDRTGDVLRSLLAGVEPVAGEPAAE